MKGFPAGIALKTPAKINLLLHIKGKRSDGYHDIITIMQMVELWDEIIIEKSERLELICSHPEIPSGHDNLVYKAALRLKEFSGIEGGAKIKLEKAIPVAAGLGGGSSDAAATLFGLNILWGLDYPNDKLMAIGRELGSDIPFFLNSPAAIGYGKGDELISLSRHTDDWFLLINPGIQISTAWAYSQAICDYNDNESLHATSPDWIGPFQGTKFELTKRDGHIKISLPNGLRIEGDQIWLKPFNDLEEVVTKRYPIIREIKEKMVACGAMCSLMSGSGSTVFGIFGDRSGAERANIMVKKDGWRSWIVRSLQSSPYSY